MHGQVRFKPSDKSDFFATLKKRVDNYFIENNISRHANSTMVVKTIVMLSGYIVPFAAILILQPPFIVSLLLWLLMGISISGIGMSVMHDANHGSYSGNDTINKIMGNTLTLIGGSVTNWKLQHNVLHHTFTNIVHIDDDIADKFVLRFSPHTKVKWYHRFQWVYAFFFYGLQTLYWVTAKDFIQFIRYTGNGTNKDETSTRLVTFMKISVYKTCYFFIIIALPILYFNIPAIEVIAGFLLMHFSAGLILTVIFQLAHTVENTSHPLLNTDGNISNDWAIHQMNTTVNFSNGNKLLSWYIGGLNFQIEHHLFPRICHVHHPKIAPIVKQTALEYGIPYLENSTFAEAFASHVATLKRFGQEESEDLKLAV